MTQYEFFGVKKGPKICFDRARAENSELKPGRAGTKTCIPGPLTGPGREIWPGSNTGCMYSNGSHNSQPGIGIENTRKCKIEDKDFSKIDISVMTSRS